MALTRGGEMRKYFCWLLVLVLLTGLAAIAASGCGGGKVATSPANDNNTTETGKTTPDTVKTPTEAELGVPIYPNARMDENSALISSQAVAARLWTDDSTDKVIAWYKEQLSGKPEYKEMPIVEGGVNEMVFGWKDGDKYKSVTVGAGKVDHPGKTEIGVGWSSVTPGKTE
jgi:hypothetical protein